MSASTRRTVSSAPPPAHSARRDQIIEAAFRRVAAEGIAGLRMRDVAVEAGINIATVHYHLTSKTELIRAVVEYTHQQFTTHALPADLATPVARLRDHLDKVFGLLGRNPALARVLAEVALESARDPVVADTVAAAETTWRRAVERILHPVPARRTRPLAALVVLTVKGACLPPAGATMIRAARRALDDSLDAMVTGG